MWTIQQHVIRYLGVIDGRTRKNEKKFKDIRAIVIETQARLAAAEFRWYDGKTITYAQFVSLCGNGLHGAVFGDRNPSDDLLKKYTAKGLPSD